MTTQTSTSYTYVGIGAIVGTLDETTREAYYAQDDWSFTGRVKFDGAGWVAELTDGDVLTLFHGDFDI